jgi:hypothetical protein
MQMTQQIMYKNVAYHTQNPKNSGLGQDLMGMDIDTRKFRYSGMIRVWLGYQIPTWNPCMQPSNTDTYE